MAKEDKKETKDLSLSISVINHRRGAITLPKVFEGNVIHGEGCILHSKKEITIAAEFLSLYVDDPQIKRFLMRGPYNGDGIEITSVGGKACDHEEGLRQLYPPSDIPSIRERTMRE